MLRFLQIACWGFCRSPAWVRLRWNTMSFGTSSRWFCWSYTHACLKERACVTDWHRSWSLLRAAREDGGEAGRGYGHKKLPWLMTAEITKYQPHSNDHRHRNIMFIRVVATQRSQMPCVTVQPPWFARQPWVEINVLAKRCALQPWETCLLSGFPFGGGGGWHEHVCVQAAWTHPQVCGGVMQMTSKNNIWHPHNKGGASQLHVCLFCLAWVWTLHMEKCQNLAACMREVHGKRYLSQAVYVVFLQSHAGVNVGETRAASPHFWLHGSCVSLHDLRLEIRSCVESWKQSSLRWVSENCNGSTWCKKAQPNEGSQEGPSAQVSVVFKASPSLQRITVSTMSPDSPGSPFCCTSTLSAICIKIYLPFIFAQFCRVRNTKNLLVGGFLPLLPLHLFLIQTKKQFALRTHQWSDEGSQDDRVSGWLAWIRTRKKERRIVRLKLYSEESECIMEQIAPPALIL